MFKASIALVLIAFGALAYGWIAGNDTVLYGSIGASALAGLALLRSTLADRKFAEKSQEEKAELPSRPRKQPKSPVATGKKGRRGGLDSEELTAQLELAPDEDENKFFESGSEPVRAFRPETGREPRRRAPEGAAWAVPDTEDEAELEEAGYERERSAHEAGFQEEPYPDEEYAEPAARVNESAAAADDFRSRLAAVLGTTGEEQAPPPPPEPRASRRGATAPGFEEPRRARRTTASAPPEEPKPARRGRRKPKPALGEPEPEPEPEPEIEPQDLEPEWIRIEDVPRISRATQPGGGFARPDIPQGITPYRPRRPGVPHNEPAEEPPPVPEQRRAPAEKTAESRVRAVSPKRPAPGPKSTVDRASGAAKPRGGAPKEPEPDAPPPRRGRPPKPKP